MALGNPWNRQKALTKVSAQASASIVVMASKVTSLNSLSVITIRKLGSVSHVVGKSVMKSIEISAWNLSGTGSGFRSPCFASL